MDFRLPFVHDRSRKENSENRDCTQRYQNEPGRPVHLPLTVLEVKDRSGESDDHSQYENESTVGDPDIAQGSM